MVVIVLIHSTKPGPALIGASTLGADAEAVADVSSALDGEQLVTVVVPGEVGAGVGHI